MNDSALILALPGEDFVDLCEHRAAYAEGTRPLSYLLILDRLSDGGVVRAKPLQTSRRALALSYHFRPELLAWKLAGRRYAMLVWGLPRRSLGKNLVVWTMLKLASRLLVNDHASAREIAIWTGQSAEFTPYIVDAEFYRFAGPEERQDFLFCPSTNDRDGEMLLRLAEAGCRIVWMNNEPSLIERYQGASPNLEIVTKPSFSKLRELYSTCRACILPLKADIHAAGQTTTLEAQACGAPVLVSRGRTSEIFEADGLVDIVERPLTEDWLRALSRLPAQDELQRRRSVTVERHSPAVVEEHLGRQLRAIG